MDEEPIAQTLRELESQTLGMKLLGSYPTDAAEEGPS